MVMNGRIMSQKDLVQIWALHPILELEALIIALMMTILTTAMALHGAAIEGHLEASAECRSMGNQWSCLFGACNNTIS